jgi:hypothetical protein
VLKSSAVSQRAREEWHGLRAPTLLTLLLRNSANTAIPIETSNDGRGRWGTEHPCVSVWGGACSGITSYSFTTSYQVSIEPRRRVGVTHLERPRGGCVDHRTTPSMQDGSPAAHHPSTATAVTREAAPPRRPNPPRAFSGICQPANRTNRAPLAGGTSVVSNAVTRRQPCHLRSRNTAERMERRLSQDQEADACGVFVCRETKS